ncbi:MAG: hypothetical protein V1878_10330, partial [bacterium]
LEAKFEPKSLSVWDNAIFGGTGSSTGVIKGNVTIAGSVHILGAGLASNDIAMDVSGTANIYNQYTGISSTLDDRLVQNKLAIAALPGKLRTELRVKRGLTKIDSSSSGVGESTCKVKGVYTNDGFTGSFPNNVYSDNGKNQKYDLPSDVNIPFPGLDSPYPPNPTITYRQWLDANSLNLAGVNKIDSTTSIPLTSSGGNSISWNGTTLTISGVVKITGNLMLAKGGNTVLYSDKGTLYVTGDVNINDCVLPVDPIPATPAMDPSFPTINCIGIIAGNNIDLNCGQSQVQHCGAFYAQGTIKANKQTQTAGTWVSNYFDFTDQVPGIYQVPLLGKNLPPGMPGGDPYFFIKTVYWREVTN